ncbi:MAG: hypothetical protein JRJ85_11325 [Deltaproteobacteria bacterium]|nr:hypothetical protein [Deltaproteobacteria bacterium]
MKMTLDSDGIQVTITNENVVSIEDVVEEVVRPCLIGIGFHPDSVDHYLNTSYSESKELEEDFCIEDLKL